MQLLQLFFGLLLVRNFCKLLLLLVCNFPLTVASPFFFFYATFVLLACNLPRPERFFTKSDFSSVHLPVAASDSLQF